VNSVRTYNGYDHIWGVHRLAVVVLFPDRKQNLGGKIME